MSLFYRTEHSFASCVTFGTCGVVDWLIMANSHLSLSLYMQVYLPTGIFHEGALMLDLRTDFSLPCKLIAEEHFLYDSIFTRI